jgi:hypothetical protein
MCKERVGMMVIFGVEGSKTKEENGREGELVGWRAKGKKVSRENDSSEEGLKGKRGAGRRTGVKKG